MRKRVVITGLGPLTPIGIGKEAFWESLIAGKSGAKKIQFESCDMDQFNSQIACTIDSFSLTDFLRKRKDFRYLGRTSAFAMAATKVALEDAGLELDYLEGKRSRNLYRKAYSSRQDWVILGVGAQNMDLCEKWFRQFLKHKGPKTGFTFWLYPHVQICSVPVNVTMAFGIKGIACSVSTACASSNHAMIEAYKQILSGEEKIMVTGGADACITPFVFGGFVAMNAMSRRNDAPEKASRPFDKERDGFVMGEVQESLFWKSWIMPETAMHISTANYQAMGPRRTLTTFAAPDPDGECSPAMKNALKTAHTSPEEIDYINAHGTSTLLNDPIETLAIKKTLGRAANQVAISSTKSMTGHLIGASGGIEMIATALMMERGKIHPTINLENPGEGCDLFYVPQKPIAKEIGKAINNSFGFGGQNASILLSRYDH